MANEIDQTFIFTYNTNLVMLAQQMGSKFRGTFMESREIGKGQRAVNQIGEVEAVERTTRHADIPVIDTPHDSRWVFPRDFDWGDIVDEEDQLRTNISPLGMYTRNGLASIRRSFDDLSIGALTGDARTGIEGGTTTVFPASGQDVDVQEGAAADTGMNTDKLLAGREIIMENDVDLEDPFNQLYCAMGPKQERQLIDQVKVTSTDFQESAILDTVNGVRVLKEWFNIRIIVSTRLTLDSNSDRLCVMWAKSGMHHGIWHEIQGDIRNLPGKTRNPPYVSTAGTFGATRTEETKVVKIPCDTT